MSLDIENMKVTELRNALEERGLERKGLKGDLQKRLKEYEASSGKKGGGGAAAIDESDPEALFAYLKSQDAAIDKDDYFADGVWDIDALKDDVKLAKERANLEEDAGPAEEEGDGETEVDDVWVEGTVWRWGGTYGFVKSTDGKRTFVHAENVETDDSRVTLRSSMELKWNTGKYINGKKKGQTFAANVQCRDGSKVSWHKKCGDGDKWDREILEPQTVYKGTVKFYNFRKKFGWIKPDTDVKLEDEGVDIKADGDKGFYVAPADIVGDVGLKPGMKVEFKLYKDGAGKGGGVGACSVTGPDGADIKCPARGKETFDESIRYKGKVNMFRANGFGFITADADQDDWPMWMLGEESLKIYVDPQNISTDDSPAVLKVDQEVEFSLSGESGRGAGAVNVTAVGGGKIVAEDVEDAKAKYIAEHARDNLSDDTFKGKVSKFYWNKGFGFIESEELRDKEWGDDDENVDADTAKKIKEEAMKLYAHRNDITSTDKVVGLDADQEVSFKLYKDDRGFGAGDVTAADGSAVSGATRPAPKKKTGKRKWGRGRGRGRRGRGRGKGRWGNKRGRWQTKPSQKGPVQPWGVKKRWKGDWDEERTNKKIGAVRGTCLWWDHKKKEGQVTSQGKKYSVEECQVQAPNSRPDWKYLSKGQYVEFQTGKNRWGKYSALYVTGPQGQLITHPKSKITGYKAKGRGRQGRSPRVINVGGLGGLGLGGLGGDRVLFTSSGRAQRGLGLGAGASLGRRITFADIPLGRGRRSRRY